MRQTVSRMAPASLLALALFANTTSGQQPRETGQEEVVRLDSDLVVVTATVTDRNGNFVRGLKPSDFEILEGGKPRPVAFFGSEQLPLAVEILIDSSGSMDPKLSLARAATAQFADRLRQNDALAIWSFADDFKKLSDFTTDHNLPERMWDIEPAGETRMFDCVVDALESVSIRPEKRRALVLISDGMDNKSKRSSKDVIHLALMHGVTIYAIDLTTDVPASATATEQLLGKLTLESFAKQTGGRYLKTAGGTQIQPAFDQIVDELGSQYTFSFYPPPNAIPGQWRKITVRPRDASLTVRSRDGYTIPPVQRKTGN